MAAEGTVLIVDDEVLAAMGLQAKLRAVGWSKVLIAGSYDRAMQILEDESPTAAVVDINLKAGPSGLDFLKRAQGLDRIVILSGYGAASFEAELRDIHYDAYLEKPVTFDLVIDALG